MVDAGPAGRITEDLGIVGQRVVVELPEVVLGVAAEALVERKLGLLEKGLVALAQPPRRNGTVPPKWESRIRRFG